MSFGEARPASRNATIPPHSVSVLFLSYTRHDVMITQTLLKHNVSSIVRRTALRSLQSSAVAKEQLPSPQWLRPAYRRCESTTARQARGSRTYDGIRKADGDDTESVTAYAYPEILNIYLAPTSQTMFGGMVRVTTMVAFTLGTFVYAPGLYMDDEAPVWMIPLGKPHHTAIPLAPGSD